MNDDAPKPNPEQGAADTRREWFWKNALRGGVLPGKLTASGAYANSVLAPEPPAGDFTPPVIVPAG